MRILIVWMFFFLMCHQALGFSPDSLSKKPRTASLTISKSDTLTSQSDKHPKNRKHKPWLASLLSATAPGSGQIYNRKYWKIPIVYAGFGGLGYAVYHTASEFIGYRNAYRLDIDEDPGTDGSFKGITSTAVLKEYRDDAKRNLDVSAICLGVWYILSIVDASVDAHLFDWNMNENLSAQWHPVILPSISGQPALGIGFHMRFHAQSQPRISAE